MPSLHAPTLNTPRLAEAVSGGAQALQALSRPCLLLATLPAAGLMACATAPALVRGINPASADVLLALITLPMWLCLLVGYAGLVAAGRLDRWLGPRALQAPLVVALVTALCAFSGRAATLHQPEPVWLAWVLPTLALAAGWTLAAGRTRPAAPARA